MPTTGIRWRRAVCWSVAAIKVDRFVACTNEAASARIYAIPAKELLRAEREADEAGLAIIGVFHSHTHTRAVPEPDRCRAGTRPRMALRDRQPEARGARDAVATASSTARSPRSASPSAEIESRPD